MSERIRNEYLPVSVTHPGVTLAESLEERGMSQTQLAERTGRPRKTINEIIKGQAGITPETAIQLERVLGIPASFWNNRQRSHDESVARRHALEGLKRHLDWLGHFPVTQMSKLGWVEKRTSDVEQLDALLAFFGVASPDEWERVYGNRGAAAAYRKSASFATDSHALSAWLRKGEQDASSVPCAPYDRDRFLQALRRIRELVRETPRGLESSIRDTCAAAGVAVVFVPLIKGVHAWGATRWLTPTKAMIELSLRGRLEDIFWFTFFHECAHVLNGGKRDIFVDGKESASSSADEKNADAFSSDFLIPDAVWKKFLSRHAAFGRETVVSFARDVGVSPAIVIGRLQHEKLIAQSSALNSLRRRIETFFAETTRETGAN
ncbi:MAG TPA: HigA family addiction module antitoxin [Spirochaetia bacterium]